MAIDKIITTATKTHAAMRNCIEYVLQDQKVKDGYVGITGPFKASEINSDTVYNAFLDEKRLWNKDSGRMYMHSTVSFHKDEKVTLEQALKIGMKLANDDPFYAGHQTLVAVHQDRDHVHIHFVTNTVSYIDGRKEQHNKKDIEGLMQRTSAICAAEGLTVAQKGKHFDGSDIEEGDIVSNKTKDYRLLTNEAKSSWKASMMVQIMDAANTSSSKQEFVSSLKKQGIDVTWIDERKHITFSDQEGHKCRNGTLAKSFNIEWLQSKETLDEYITATRSEGITATEGSGIEYAAADAGATTGGPRFNPGIAGATTTIANTGINAGMQATSSAIRKSNDEQKKKQNKGAHL